MSTIFVLATGCANGFTMSASLIYGCSDSYCSGDALWYAAQMHGFCIGCCGVHTSLQHVGRRCGGAVLCNVDAGVVRSMHNDDAAVVRSVRNSVPTFICNCIADVAASVHHCACRLRCKVFATGVAMLLSSAASAKQYGCGSFALLISRDADRRYTDVCRFFGITCGCVSHDALIVVGGEIPEHARTCFNEYLQCAYATASGGGGYSVGIAHTPDGKCADTLSSPNFKAAASHRLKPHAESTESAEWIFRNTNHTNFTNGNVGSRLGATEWTGTLKRFFRASPKDANSPNRDSSESPSYMPNFGIFGSRADNTSDYQQTLRKCPEIACRMWRKVPEKASE